MSRKAAITFLSWHQRSGRRHLAGCAGHSHYAGWESRDIKALSSSDIEGLRAGHGMSLALAAELNGYPGPLHVLELADKLALTPAQVAQAHARLRGSHLQAHLEQVRILTPEQVGRYNSLRGYGA